MSEHTKEPWRAGRKGAVVADEPVTEISGSDDVDHYGGHLVAESVAPRNVRRIVACVNACAGLSTEGLEAMGLGGVKSAIKVNEAREEAFEREREHLLAVLKKAVASQAYRPGTGPEWWEEGRSAIAAAESGQ